MSKYLEVVSITMCSEGKGQGMECLASAIERGESTFSEFCLKGSPIFIVTVETVFPTGCKDPGLPPQKTPLLKTLNVLLGFLRSTRFDELHIIFPNY